MGCPTHHRTTHFFLFACKSLIHFHQLGNAGALAGAGGAAFYKTIGIHHSAVIGLVRLAQFRRHGQFIVKVCQAAVRVERTGIKDSLRGLLDFLLLLFSWGRPREIVIDKCIRVTIVAF